MFRKYQVFLDTEKICDLEMPSGAYTPWIIEQASGRLRAHGHHENFVFVKTIGFDIFFRKNEIFDEMLN